MNFDGINRMNFLLPDIKYRLFSLENGPWVLRQFFNHPLATLVRGSEVTEESLFPLIGRRRSGKKAQPFGQILNNHGVLMISIRRHRPAPSEIHAMAGKFHGEWKRSFHCGLCASSDPERSRRGTGGEAMIRDTTYMQQQTTYDSLNLEEQHGIF
jgi:hypothetical protein